MWTATFQEVNKDTRTAVILFTDGIKYKVLGSFDLEGQTSSQFRNQVEARRAQLEASYGFIDSLDPKSFNLTPDANIPPTAADLDKQHYLKLTFKLASAKRQVDLGVVDANDKSLTDLEAEVKAAYKPEYFGL